MDKFGVFKLLNSFFDYYKSNPPTKNTEKEDNSSKENNPLSSLLNAFTGGKQNKVKEKQTPPTPLQANMIGVMNSHDDFIRRVKTKNST